MDSKSTEVRTVSSTGGEKGSKLERFDLIPTDSLTELARLYGEGAKKYAERNWERGYEFSKSYAALQRHANQFWSGEDVDQETGRLHIIAVAWHAMALAHFLMNEKYVDFDDRPKPAPDVFAAAPTTAPPTSKGKHRRSPLFPEAFPGFVVVVDNKGKEWWRREVIVELQYQPEGGSLKFAAAFPAETIKAKVKRGKVRDARIEIHDIDDKLVIAQSWMPSLRHGYTIHITDGITQK